MPASQKLKQFFQLCGIIFYVPFCGISFKIKLKYGVFITFRLLPYKGVLTFTTLCTCVWKSVQKMRPEEKMETHIIPTFEDILIKFYALSW